MTQRLGILVSHPIQYYAPWFRYLAERMDLEIFYAHKQDAKGQAAAGFGVEFEWDLPLLERYPYRWLKNVSLKPSVGTFRGLDTPELYDIIQPGKFDSFLLFGWNRKCSWQAIRACRKAGTPVLMRGDSHLGSNRSALTSVTKYLPYRAFLPRIDAHLYVGKRNKAYLKHYGVAEEQLFFSPHFVDVQFFATRARDAELSGRADDLRAQLKIPREAFVFLFVGKLIDKKHPGDLLAAHLSTRITKPREVHVVFVGDGPLLNSLRAQSCADPSVHFVGFQNQSEISAYYQLANALVLPSDGDESWGLVVNEGMACLLPCLVSESVGCAPDLIDQNRTGITFPTGNIDALGKRMVELMFLIESDGIKMKVALQQKSAIYSMRTATDGLIRAIQTLQDPKSKTVESLTLEQRNN